MQRLCTFLFGLFCLTGLCLASLRRAKRVAIFQMVFAIGGLYFASRQIWLQSLPVDQTAACMPSLDMLIQFLSKTQVLTALLWGTGDCGDVGWKWLGISMSIWSAAYFIAMFLISAVVFWMLGRPIIAQKSK